MMKIKLDKSFPYQFLFALCIGVTYINIFELTLFVWLITIFLTLKNKYSFDIIKNITPFLAIFFIAFVVFFFQDNSNYNAIRDVTYLLKPILGLILGYQLCKSKDVKPFETIIYTGLLIAIIHLILLSFNIVFYRITNIHTLRGLTGYFSDFEVYALLLLIFHKKFELNFCFVCEQYRLVIAT